MLSDIYMKQEWQLPFIRVSERSRILLIDVSSDARDILQ